MHMTQSQVDITSVLLHIRKPGLGFDQGPVTAATTSLSRLNLAGAPAHTGFIVSEPSFQPASVPCVLPASLSLRQSPCFWTLAGRCSRIVEQMDDHGGIILSNFYEKAPLCQALFKAQPHQSCFQMPTSCPASGQHCSFPPGGQRCPRVSAARSGSGSSSRP